MTPFPDFLTNIRIAPSDAPEGHRQHPEAQADLARVEEGASGVRRHLRR